MQNITKGNKNFRKEKEGKKFWRNEKIITFALRYNKSFKIVLFLNAYFSFVDFPTRESGEIFFTDLFRLRGASEGRKTLICTPFNYFSQIYYALLPDCL